MIAVTLPRKKAMECLIAVIPKPKADAAVIFLNIMKNIVYSAL